MKYDSKYIDQRKEVLLIPGHKYVEEFDTTKWRLEDIENICDVSGPKTTQ